jgi:TPR repeat protein
MRTFLLAALLFAVGFLGGPVGAQSSEAMRDLFQEYKAGAERGDAKSRWMLGMCYKSGLGTEKNVAEGIKWLVKASDQGFAQAQSSLGQMFFFGDGVSKDYVEALKWYRKGAEHGDADCQCDLGQMFRYGWGTVQDETEALKWFQKAAAKNSAWGQCEIGEMYSRGEGVKKDLVEGYAWLNLAARPPYGEAAGKERNTLEVTMSSQQIIDAQKRTKELRAEIEAKLKGGK